MRSNYNSRWQNADHYRAVFLENTCSHSRDTSLFYRDGEITGKRSPGKIVDDGKIDKLIEAGELDQLCAEIVCRVAASKYLTLDQIAGYLARQGVRFTVSDIHKRIKLLVQCRFLRALVFSRDWDISPECYCLGFYGAQLAREAGVPMHKGNQYLTLKQKANMGMPQEEAPYEIKRILAANQFILSLFGSDVEFCRFGFMETLILPSMAREGSLVRTTCNVSLDGEDTLMYEVVRRTPDWQENLVGKIRRFAGMVYAPTFMEENNWGLTNYPQLVLCGETQEHNREIFAALKNSGLFGEYPELEVLFTSDAVVNQAPEKLYAFGENGGQIWYDMPRRTPAARAA